MSLADDDDGGGLIVDINLKVGNNAISAAFRTSAAGVTALFGPSGAGKTSVLHAIAGLLPPVSGRISLGHHLLYDSFSSVDIPAHRRRAGLVFQDNRLFPHMTVQQNLTFGAKALAQQDRSARLGKITKLLDVQPLLKRRPATLSGGERKRVAIGRALLSAPKVLLMDEPLTGLDSARREDVLSHIARIAQSEQIPIVYVTHSLDEVLRLADRLVIIEDGKVSADGSVGSVLNSRAKSGHLPPDERATVVEGLIEAAGGKGGLSIVDTPIGLVQIAGLSAPPRARVRLRLRAADISLALREPQDVSINNILPGHVVEISQDGPAAALVMLDCGAPLMARVTQNSVQRLGLAPGVRLYAMIKAVAVERVSIGGLLDSRPLGWPGD